MLMYVASVLGTNTEVCGNSMLGMTFTRRNLVEEPNYAFHANILECQKLFIFQTYIYGMSKHKSRTNYHAFVRSKQYYYNIT